MSLDDYFQSKSWRITDVQRIPPRKAQYYGYNEVGLSVQSVSFLERNAPRGIYRHQKEAVEESLVGENVCLTTGAASGKSLVFYVSAIEQLVKHSGSKIIAIYPLRALGKEQEGRWVNSLRSANLNVKVGRIDGQVPMEERRQILRNSQVLIVTPDIIHAWFLYNLSDTAAINFLSRISLIIVDEVHNYTGVFGSNSAYLFRRMQHLMKLLGSSPQYIAASATIAAPELHLKRLLGVDFKIIGPGLDSSPRQGVTIKLVEPLNTKDLLSTLSELTEFIAKNTDHKFITFVDSRKQTEYVTSIISRSQIQEDEGSLSYDHLQRLNVLPYRAGYELNDRNAIQERLSSGRLTGVVSTSALELGIDIPFLTLGILVGVPHSATSFYQRIGRIGRHSKGEVIVINTGDVYSESIFRNPKQLLNMPLSEVALYLQNPRIQYIHALCLARHGGEHNQVCSFLNMEEISDFESPIDWPEGFSELCKSERIGIIPTELQSISAQAGDDPNHTYPLRDVDIQFQIEHKTGPIKESLGSLSYSQLMREAYPGAVYYYITKPYRVYRVRVHQRLVEVRHERKRYTTRPQILPTLVFPDLSSGNAYVSQKYGDLIVAECSLRIRESIVGIKERRGPNEFTIDYPLDPSLGFYFDRPRFTRNYFTTGVVLTHPIFNSLGVHCDAIANLLFEAFLMVVPFERHDINFASDKHRAKTGAINEGDRFVCIYDQTYGSLRLSGHILEEQILKQVLEKGIELAQYDENLDINSETIIALERVLASLSEPPIEFSFELEKGLQIDTDRFVRVIMPGSKGLNINKDNEEFLVEGVFYSPAIRGLAYRGRYTLEIAQKFEGMTTTISVDSLKEIPGESRLGLYNYETGEIRELE